MGHNYFVAKKGESLRHFLSGTSEVNVHLNVALGLHRYVHNIAARKKLCREAVLLKDVEILPTFVFVYHGHVRPIVRERLREHCKWYQSHFTSDGSELCDAVALVYEEGIAPMSEKHAMWLHRSLD